MEPTHVTPAFPGYPDFKPDDHAKTEAIWFERGQIPPRLRDVDPADWPVWAQKYRNRDSFGNDESAPPHQR